MTEVIARDLIGVALVAYADRDVIAHDPELRKLVAEVAGLFDSLSGLAITNPEQRAEGHMVAINRWALTLPEVGR